MLSVVLFTLLSAHYAFRHTVSRVRGRSRYRCPYRGPDARTFRGAPLQRPSYLGYLAAPLLHVKGRVYPRGLGAPE
jgi:hypothetical protein